MSILPTISGNSMRVARLSQKKSAEEISSAMGLSRNSYLNYEKGDGIVPIQIVKDFTTAMELSHDEFLDLLQNLQEMKSHEDEDKNSEFNLAPKKVENLLYNNFVRDMGAKDSTINSLQFSNEKIRELLHREELNNLQLKNEIDKIMTKFDGLKTEVESYRRFAESLINEKAEKIESRLSTMVKDTLDQYSKQVGQAIKESEGGGLGDFIQQSGLNSLISNPAFGSAIGQWIANAMTPTQKQPPNPINYGQNTDGSNTMSGFDYPPMGDIPTEQDENQENMDNTQI